MASVLSKCSLKTSPSTAKGSAHAPGPAFLARGIARPFGAGSGLSRRDGGAVADRGESGQAPPPTMASTPVYGRPGSRSRSHGRPLQLSMPGFGEPTSYAIRRHTDGGGRKDILTLGEPDDPTPFVRLRSIAPDSEPDSFGRAGRTSLNTPPSSARGADCAARTADQQIRREALRLRIRDRPVSANCVGFSATSTIRACRSPAGSAGRRASVRASTMSCALDRLTLMSAGSDPEIGGCSLRPN